MRVLLTGAAGFIGSHLARFLLRQGCEVYALLRPTSDPWRIKDLLPSLKVHSCDLRNQALLETHLKQIQPDLCFHMAWDGMRTADLRSAKNLDSVLMSLHLLQGLAAVRCRRILMAGTCAEYDADLGCVSETSPARPRSAYAASKHALYLISSNYLETVGVEIAWLRFFSLYGPFEDPQRFVPSVICSLLQQQVAKVTLGERYRDYLHVQDAVSAVWAIAMSNFKGAVNIGSGHPISTREIALKIGALTGQTERIAFGALPYREGDPLFLCANTRRLKEAIGWTPQFDLSGGLRHTVDWWKSHLAGG